MPGKRKSPIKKKVVKKKVMKKKKSPTRKRKSPARKRKSPARKRKSPARKKRYKKGGRRAPEELWNFTWDCFAQKMVKKNITCSTNHAQLK